MLPRAARQTRAMASHSRHIRHPNARSRFDFLSPARNRGLLRHRLGLFEQQKRDITSSLRRPWIDTQATGLKSNHSDTVRKLMRHVPHPVAIVTAAPKDSADNKTNASHWRGATISSFVTVALDPEPVVCFNIKQNSSTFATLAQSSHFNIHILRSNPEAEAIATKFASGNALEPFHDGEGELEWWVREPVEQEGSAPIIESNSNELEDEVNELEDEVTAKDSVVSFRLSCIHVADKTVAIGDHVVVFGRVVGIVHGLDKAESGSMPPTPCLLYVEGGYSRTVSK